MSKTIYEPKPRYEVQQGEAEYSWESDAITYAKLMAKDHEFVRVIDREA